MGTDVHSCVLFRVGCVLFVLRTFYPAHQLTREGTSTVATRSALFWYKYTLSTFFSFLMGIKGCRRCDLVRPLLESACVTHDKQAFFLSWWGSNAAGGLIQPLLESACCHA